jgi:hypothetical protein
MAADTAIASSPCCCFSLFFLLAGGSATLYGAQQYLLCQKIANTPTSKVRSAAAGLVELLGKAKCKDDMASPISKAKSIYWHISAEYYHSGRRNSGWRNFYAKSSSNQFYLEDDTGRMLIEPKDAEVRIPSDYSCQGHLSDKALFGLLPQKQLDKKVLDWLESDPTAKAAFNAHGGSDLKVTESFIAEGDTLYVLGSAEPLPSAASAVREENLIVKKNNIDKIMFISDSGENKFLDGMRFWSVVYMVIGLGMLFAGLLGMLFNMGAFVM